MKLRSVRRAWVANKRVLVRLELNVARTAFDRASDDLRLRASIPTLSFLRKHGARIIVATHLGRPKGRVVSYLSTKRLARPLSRALGTRVLTAGDCIGTAVKQKVNLLKPRQVLLLENTRFHPGEEKNNPSFARSLASLADVFVLESFGSAHRKHASIVGIGKFLPSYAGLRFVKEVETLSKIIENPRRPLVALLGGAKISSKLALIISLLRRVDALMLGGALANTVLKAKGLQIGTSFVEKEALSSVKALPLTTSKLHLPVDVVVRSQRGAPLARATGAVGLHETILDIGPDTVELFRSIIHAAGSVVWNGPMGKYEHRPFDQGTRQIAQAITRSRAYSVVGGGETVDAISSQGLFRKINFVSTGGGAMLEFLEGRRLPGVELVREKS